MSSILDIDLDYFATLRQPLRRLEELLSWGGRPVTCVVGRHHEVLSFWKAAEGKGTIATPSHILHVDEHHDMMDEQRRPNIANFIYHAMLLWPSCQLFWLVDAPIDSPAMWLSEDSWSVMKRRFTFGSKVPDGWPKPDLVSVCTSPEFLDATLRTKLVELIQVFNRSCDGW